MADTILVIDDSVTVRTAVRWVVESAGYRVLEAESLQAARALLANEQPDSILLDYHLPDGKGVDFCGELRQDPRFASSKILILHGDAHPFDPEDARTGRASGALRKPFRSQTLLDLLAQPQDTQATVETDAVQTPPPAAPAPPAPEEEETIFAEADIVDESAPTPAPPSPGRKPVRTRSGAFRTPPMPGSGLHRVAPPGGQKVSVAGRGTMPRSPSGAFRPVDEHVPEAPPAPTQTTPPPQESVPAPAPTPQQSGRNEPTAEVNVLDDEDIEPSSESATQSTHKTYQLNEQELRAQIEEILGSVIEEKLEAIVEKELPAIARRALAGLLRTELNEQIVRLGVTRRVQQFLDNDLPNYAQRAVDRRLDQNNDS